MKDRTITQKLNMSSIEGSLKNELREAQTEGKRSKKKNCNIPFLNV